jgi:hypothetical protein
LIRRGFGEINGRSTLQIWRSYRADVRHPQELERDVAIDYRLKASELQERKQRYTTYSKSNRAEFLAKVFFVYHQSFYIHFLPISLLMSIREVEHLSTVKATTKGTHTSQRNRGKLENQKSISAIVPSKPCLVTISRSDLFALTSEVHVKRCFASS